jgi:hypothetical protein
MIGKASKAINDSFSGLVNRDSILTRLTEGRQALEETLTQYRRGDLDTMTARTLIYGSSVLLAYLAAEREAETMTLRGISGSDPVMKKG